MYMCNQPLIVTCTIKERSRIECEPDLVHPIFVLSHSVYNNKSMSMHYCSIQLINLYLHALVHSTCVPHAHNTYAHDLYTPMHKRTHAYSALVPAVGPMSIATRETSNFIVTYKMSSNFMVSATEFLLKTGFST